MQYKIGQEVVINGIRGVIRRQRTFVEADRVRDNPAFDPNYESEQGKYSGPLWYPLDPHSAGKVTGKLDQNSASHQDDEPNQQR